MDADELLVGGDLESQGILRGSVDTDDEEDFDDDLLLPWFRYLVLTATQVLGT